MFKKCLIKSSTFDDNLKVVPIILYRSKPDRGLLESPTSDLVENAEDMFTRFEVL